MAKLPSEGKTRRPGAGGFFARHKRALLSAVLAVAVVVAGGIWFTRGKPSPVVPNPQTSPSSQASSAPAAPIAARRADIAAAKEKNNDVIGWLTVPGTSLDMPIVHTTDNDFYLTHGLDKKPDSTGRATPFMDYRNNADVLGRNTIVYGHHMATFLSNLGVQTKLFGDLEKYRELDFLNQHPLIYFGTGTEDRYWKIFAAYPTDTNFYYIDTDFKDDDEFMSLVAQMKKQSLFNTNVDVEASDKILTLSTCTYEEFGDSGNGRFVIEARLVRPGESYDVSAAVKNPDPASPFHKKTS